MRSWRVPVGWAVAALMALLTGCGGGSAPAGTSPPEAGGGGATGEITVFAAASLTEAFEKLGADFEAANPDTTVTFNFAGSSTLARQITSGAPADVFASANTTRMQKVVDAGLAAGEPTIFVRNTLQIVVPGGNPAGVTGLADFGKEELTTAICAAEVPCGALSQQLFESAGVAPAPATLEQDVKAVLTKVSLGEADAGLVYRTDVASGGEQVEGIDFPEAEQGTNEYPITALTDAPNPELAGAFVDHVLSAEGQAVLEEFGFLTVPA
jgi:molybdate transport system substrate-binding protein